MNASFEPALHAAHAAAAMQDHPMSTLYMVGTPIGNLADIGLRALHILSLADCIACEDTRHSQSLLRAYGIDKRADQWLSVHQHNEAQASEKVLALLRQGQRVACVSDAGTPGISDPGARLARVVAAHGLRVLPIPGASSLTTLLSACGSTHAQDTGFVFWGFLPAKGSERQAALQALAFEHRTQVLLESPHRVLSLAADLSALGERPLTVGRELTKQFEEVATMPAQQMGAWLAHSPQRQRGEFTLVLHHAAQQTDELANARKVLGLLLAHLPVKTAVRLAADITGQARNLLYPLALQIQQADEEAHRQ
ncbi:MAG: 16S rRNA (cytidine(1402)-2'-O)-methyltransferase [Betaproteobacteria bacterium]|nr:16S rRNA (cytidine(1402)-2'-O)-methyltransferase [Betaproteobacteria bacterium]